MGDHRVVVKDVRYVLAHVPGLVRHGVTPARELRRDPTLAAHLQAHLRSYEDAVAYPPHQVLLGVRTPDDLRRLPRPWWRQRTEPSEPVSAPAAISHQPPTLTQRSALSAQHSFGELLAEQPFYAWLKIADAFDLVTLAADFVEEMRPALRRHPLVTPNDLARLGPGQPLASVEALCAGDDETLPLALRDGRLVGCVRRDEEEDAALTSDVLLENLAAKATSVLALRALLREGPTPAADIEYVLGCGEEAVGDSFQRGGGGLAKAVAEFAGCANATGADVKAFCCAPAHALVLAASLVAAGVYRDVVVVGGGSVPKLGMKLLGHAGGNPLAKDQPVLEDVLPGIAILVGPDDGRSPVLRLDAVGRHHIGAGASQQAILEALVAEPLARLSLRFGAVDKYATELHDPEITEPAGAGNVPLLNYRQIAALAAVKGEIGREAIPAFVERYGLPGFAPTQGPLASAVPFLGHALAGLRAGAMQRVMFIAKGSLFRGRMTQMADGLSFVLEANQKGGQGQCSYAARR